MYDLNQLRISSTQPCLIVYLIDQSNSMSEQFGNASHSKATELAKVINDAIYDIGLRCINTHGSNIKIKNRFEIAIISYGKDTNHVQSAWEGALANKWVVSIEEIFDSHSSLGTENGKPIWIKPYAIANTPMTKAFENTKRLCKDWINWGNHKDCHPPIVINITDGQVTDAGHNFNALRNEINEIKQLRTNYGEVNILNIYISARTGNKLLFPNQISNNISDEFEKLLFEISTPLNANMINIARAKGYNIESNARGYIYNGDAKDLVNFLNIGTPI